MNWIHELHELVKQETRLANAHPAITCAVASNYSSTHITITLEIDCQGNDEALSLAYRCLRSVNNKLH